MTRVLAILLLLAPAPAQALSAAARFLIDEAVAEGCPSGGSMDTSRVVERDLDGDGRADLILSHEWVTCTGGGSSISGLCGMQVCTTYIYLRRGDLLVEQASFLNSVVSVGDGPRPAITLRSHGGATGTIRWDGRSFSR